MPIYNVEAYSDSRTLIIVLLNEKLTTDCVSLHNNDGLISKVSEDSAGQSATFCALQIASGNAENCRSRQPHCRLTTPSQGTSASIRINLMSSETKVVGLHFAADSMGLSSFIFCGGLRETHLFCSRVRINRSRSSKVVDFGTNRKGVCDFLLVINSNFGVILHRF